MISGKRPRKWFRRRPWRRRDAAGSGDSWGQIIADLIIDIIWWS